jgi:ribose transport system permease protein
MSATATSDRLQSPATTLLARFRWADLAPSAVLAILMLVVYVRQPTFFSSGVTVLSLQAAPILLLALGQMVVFRIGSIDLSNAAVTVFAAIVSASALAPLGALAIPLTLAVGAFAGLLNGALAAGFQVPSFSVTLGAGGVWLGTALLLSGATTVYVGSNIEVLSWLTDYQFGGAVMSFWLALGIAVVLWLTIHFTSFGQGLTVMGFNERTAMLSNVRTQRVRVGAFVVSGVLASVAGMCVTAQQGAATASGFGVGLLMPAIAAAIVGGCAITGGVGHPLNVVIGALIIAFIPIESAALGVEANIQQLVYGVVVVVATAITLDRRRVPR